MSRPTIALCMIAKNEAHNIGPLLASVAGCFDEIHITDTGSTDPTVTFIEKINEQIKNGSQAWAGLPEIKVHHFDWVNDFAKAREYSFSHAKTDYVMWLDLDDLLDNKEAFIDWRDNVMHSAHYWLALYNYAFDDKGQPVCQFVRERVVKRGMGFNWQFPVHEGLIPPPNKRIWPQRVSSWCVNHKRTEAEATGDRGRNIKIMEALDQETCHPRMKFYYGKELWESGDAEKAAKPLHEALKSPELDIHDRVLAIQYAAQTAVHLKRPVEAIELLMNGLKLMPSRAEYHCLIGEIYAGLGQVDSAVLSYKTALLCKPNNMGGIIVLYGTAYFDIPHTQCAALLLNNGRVDEALEHIQALEAAKHPQGLEFRKAYERLVDLNEVRSGLPKSGDILITCPPGGVVKGWDENSLKLTGHGGSETAAIEVARLLAEKTGRKVKVFHDREKREVMPSGVEYFPTSELMGYVHNVEPFVHIAWRHATRLTKARTIVWAHDLELPGGKNDSAYDQVIALSGFHKKYLKEVSGVPENKIVLGFNGINPEEFKGPKIKDPLKVIFSSSPDRGLVQSIDIVKKAREISGLDLKLHCFYGTDNMRKMGHHEWADSIENKIRENDFVVYHGNVGKKVLADHFKSSAVWLYPADFIETYCITAIEALCAGTWPIVRAMGALPYTLSEAIEKNHCDILDVEVVDEASTGIWAHHLVNAIHECKWKDMDFDPDKYSWDRVAEHFKKEFSL